MHRPSKRAFIKAVDAWRQLLKSAFNAAVDKWRRPYFRTREPIGYVSDKGDEWCFCQLAITAPRLGFHA